MRRMRTKVRANLPPKGVGGISSPDRRTENLPSTRMSTWPTDPILHNRRRIAILPLRNRYVRFLGSPSKG